MSSDDEDDTGENRFWPPSLDDERGRVITAVIFIGLFVFAVAGVCIMRYVDVALEFREMQTRIMMRGGIGRGPAPPGRGRP